MLTSGARWVSQAEPQSYRADFSDVVGLVVNADGTFMTERLFAREDGQGIVGAKDLDPNAQPVRLSPNALGTFQVVFARSLGQVYVLSEGQIWSGPVDPSAGTFGLLMPDAPIGTVLAATYEPLSRALLALRDDGELVKIPVFGGAPKTMAVVESVENWPLHYLVADRNGSVFIAQASDTEHMVWSVSPEPFSLQLLREGEAGLPVAPVVELDGYLLVERVASDEVALNRIPVME